MSLYETLLENYGYNEPVMTNEIVYKNYSRPWIYKELNKLCKNGQIIRYDKGIYYIPTQTILGPSVLNPRKVIEKKYIGNKNNTIGYYSGVTFLNIIGVSTQMPNIIEVYTNKETSTVRDVMVGRQKVLLRKARTTITEDNAAVLSFLEMMNSVSPSFFDDERRQIICEYIEKREISRKAITKYASIFPDKAMRTLVESEVIYSVTR